MLKLYLHDVIHERLLNQIHLTHFAEKNQAFQRDVILHLDTIIMDEVQNSVTGRSFVIKTSIFTSRIYVHGK